MEKETRNAIERATQRARRLLEEDYTAQLEGEYDILPGGKILEGAHLTPREAFRRDKIVSVIEHKRAAGMDEAESVADYIRDAAFTTLNRFVALKMLEARGLMQECITKGEQSSGYKEFTGLAPGLAAIPDGSGYRLYIESLFDELSTEIKVLFDRRDAASILWPRRQTFEGLLATLNVQELAAIWGEPETVGWVYQFFNRKEERTAHKADKRLPETGREIALRSQYFTPRSVVQMLCENTLGRVWLDMTGNPDELKNRYSKMLVRPEDYRQRARKDPRDLRVLDPACGSGHFLICAFQMFVQIYQDAWHSESQPGSTSSGRSLKEDYPRLEDLRAAIPALIVKNNLYGIDIDPRCAQLTGFALWLSAQEAYDLLEVPRGERHTIRKSNIVAAGPIASTESVVQEFERTLPSNQQGMFRALRDAMTHASTLGSLLRVDQDLREIARAESGELGRIFDWSDDRGWVRKEIDLVAALAAFESSRPSEQTMLRLFAEDSAHTLEFIDILRQEYDVVVMNPPYTEVGGIAGQYLRDRYPESWTNLYSAFVERGLILSKARLGIVCSDGILTGYRMRNLRRGFVEDGQLVLMAPLDGGTFDDMGLPTVAFVLERDGGFPRPVFGKLAEDHFQIVADVDPRAISAKVDYVLTPEMILHGGDLWNRAQQLGDKLAIVTTGNRTFDDSRFVRAWWEVDPKTLGNLWHPWQKGGEYQPFFSSTPLVIRWDWDTDGREMRAVGLQKVGTDAQVAQSSRHWWQPGLVGPTIASQFNVRILPKGQVLSAKSVAIFPSDSRDTLYLLGVLNSQVTRWLLVQQGAGLAGNTGKVQNLPIPNPNEDERAEVCRLALEALRTMATLEGSRETSPYFVGPFVSQHDVAALQRVTAQLDATVNELYGGVTVGDAAPPGDVLSNKAVAAATGVEGSDFETPSWRLLSYLLGVAFGRWGSVGERQQRESELDDFLTAVPREPPSTGHASRPVLVDDVGHPSDVVAAVNDAAEEAIGDTSAVAIDRVLAREKAKSLRSWLRDRYFDLHRGEYTSGRRKAPIYWQISTSSRQYSIWLYLHGADADTMYRLDADYLGPKIEAERRKLAAMRSRGSDSASNRRELSAQEELVSELEILKSEVARVAPIWTHARNDGVLVMLAPLWRLFAGNAAWQSELKKNWEQLVEGEMDWAELAMRLWPERVIPRCADDRSLAIAHGMEDIFWVEGENGKWLPRPRPTRSVEELVKERTSPAVKAALKSLLEAPPPAGSTKRGRKSKKVGGSD